MLSININESSQYLLNYANSLGFKFINFENTIDLSLPPSIRISLDGFQKTVSINSRLVPQDLLHLIEDAREKTIYVSILLGNRERLSTNQEKQIGNMVNKGLYPLFYVDYETYVKMKSFVDGLELEGTSFCVIKKETTFSLSPLENCYTITTSPREKYKDLVTSPSSDTKAQVYLTSPQKGDPLKVYSLFWDTVFNLHQGVRNLDDFKALIHYYTHHGYTLDKNVVKALCPQYDKYVQQLLEECLRNDT